MHTENYILIGLCSLILGLIYVSTVILYVHLKRKKKKLKTESSKTRKDANSLEFGHSKNDQVTFGNGFVRNDSVYSLSHFKEYRNNKPLNRRMSPKEEMGMVKDNPLLQHFSNLDDQCNFASDLSNSNSECEEKIVSKNQSVCK